jgi:hypothetical protein
MKDSLISLLEYYIKQLNNDTLSHGHQQLLWDNLTSSFSVHDNKEFLTNYMIGQYIRSVVSSEYNFNQNKQE